MDLTGIIDKINEASAELGGREISVNDWKSVVKACVVPPATQAQYDEKRQKLSNSNEVEVKNEVANATKVNDSSIGDFVVVKTSSGAALPDITESKPSKSDVKSGYCCSNSSKIYQFPSGKAITKDEVVFKGADDAVQSIVEEEESKAKSDYDKQQNMKNVFNKVNKAYKDSDVQKARKEAMQDPKKCSKQAEDKTVYVPDFFVSEGKEVKFNTSVVQVDWTGYFRGNVEKDLDTLNSLVSRFISKNYGGFKNIRRIVVRDERIIINNKNCIIPRLDESCMLNMPNDSGDYVKNGALASFFDWYYISKMSNLGVLDFDSKDLVLDKIMPDLGWGGAMGTDVYKCLFSSNPNLREVIISDESVTRTDLIDMLNEEKKTGRVSSKGIVEKLNRKARYKQIYRDTISQDNGTFWNRAFAGKAPNIIGATDTWREWQWGTVKSYATNRGDKGFLRYSFGTIGRVGLALAVTPLTFAPRFIKGVGGMIKGVFKEATTAISDDEMYERDIIE